MVRSDARTAESNAMAVRRLFACSASKDLEGWLALWHPDGRQTFPAGSSEDLIGFEALRSSAEAKFASRQDVEIDVRVEPMADPRRVFAELDISMRLSSDRPRFRTTVWCRFQFDDQGLILEQQELFDGAAIQRAVAAAAGESSL